MASEGPQKISIGLGKAKKPGQPLPTNGVKRPHAALRDDEDEGQDEVKTQTVSHFDKTEGGAYDERKGPKKDVPLVIASQANRDWREASKRRKQRNGLPVEAQTTANGKSREEIIKAVEDAAKPTYGLNVKSQDVNEDSAMAEGDGPDAAGDHSQQLPPEPNAETSTKAKTDEELAMDALLGKTTKSDLVLPAVDEEQAFQQDFKDAPDMATLDDYARVPVEQFGAALLRGMGWKEGEGIGNQRGAKVQKAKPLERRPALLGIGAKEEAAVAQEMGTWGKAAKDRKGPPVIYNPVLLRDKKTGEMLTEEEVEKRKERAEKERLDLEFDERERAGEHTRSRRHGARSKERDRDRDRREKHNHHRRDEDSDEEYRRKKEERRRRDREREDSDDEYYRRKQKERSHQDRRGDERDYDRKGSRRHNRDRERHRDRQRDDRR